MQTGNLRIACLCPTYDRPRLLENAIACFERQDYPADLRRLVILDDGHSVPETESPNGWRIVSAAERFPSLPDKYARLAELAVELKWSSVRSGGDWYSMGREPFDPDAFAVWEDDDVYLPWHLSAHAEALAGHHWSKPPSVFSTYGSPGKPKLEAAAGRFFASLAFRREFFDEVGGFVRTRRADFDQRFIARLRAHAPPGDPTAGGRPPGYVFRWGDTGRPHGQGRMRGPDDETWWDRCAGAAVRADRVTPRLDHYAAMVFESLGIMGVGAF